MKRQSGMVQPSVSGVTDPPQHDQNQDDQEEEEVEDPGDDQTPDPEEQEEEDLKLAKKLSLQAMHDTQLGDGGSASSIAGPRDPGKELHAALNEQTRLNEELNRLNQRQRAGGQTKEDALRYTTIMTLLGQTGSQDHRSM